MPVKKYTPHILNILSLIKLKNLLREKMLMKSTADVRANHHAVQKSIFGDRYECPKDDDVIINDSKIEYHEHLPPSGFSIMYRDVLKWLLLVALLIAGLSSCVVIWRYS